MLLPTTLLGLFVGTVIDRFDVLRTTIACEVLSGVLAAAFAVLTLGGWITVWEIYALAGASAASSPRSTGPARHALVFQMVGSQGSAERGRADVEPRHDGARARPRHRRLRRRVRRPGHGVRAQRGELRRGRRAACSRSTDRVCCTRTATPTRPCSAAPPTRCASSASSRRALVAFIAVFALSTFSFNFNVLLPLVADKTLHSGAGGVRPDRRGVRSGSAVRLDDQRDRRTRFPASAADRRGRVRLLRAAARAAALAARRRACCSS